MSVPVITRLDFPQRVEAIVGFDVSPEEADELVDVGKAEYAPELEPPSAVWLIVDMPIRGIFYPLGTLLQVDGHITEAEAIALLRGRVATGEAWATVPVGPVG